MSELLQFLMLLKRNKITLILVPVITVIVSYFLVKRLPDSYEAHARIATGLVDKTDQAGTYITVALQVVSDVHGGVRKP